MRSDPYLLGDGGRQLLGELGVGLDGRLWCSRSRRGGGGSFGGGVVLGDGLGLGKDTGRWMLGGFSHRAAGKNPRRVNRQLPHQNTFSGLLGSQGLVSRSKWR